MVQVGQVYGTGNLIFEIVDFDQVTRHYTRVTYKILNAGAFSDDTFDYDLSELEKHIESGEAHLMLEEVQ